MPLNLDTLLSILVISYIIYAVGAMFSFAYVVFWNSETHVHHDLKPIDEKHMFKSWYFFLIKKRLHAENNKPRKTI